MLPEFDLSGKTVLITGAGRGIGKGIALALAEAGADVAVTSLTEANAARVAESVRRLGRRGLGYSADSMKLAEMEAVAKKLLAEFGHLDTLINCVGDAIPGPVAPFPDKETRAISEADWHAIIDINLTQAFVGCHVFGPHLIEQRGGSVINISSFAALRPSAYSTAYASAKTGLLRFTESLALEWAPSASASTASRQAPSPMWKA